MKPVPRERRTRHRTHLASTTSRQPATLATGAALRQCNRAVVTEYENPGSSHDAASHAFANPNLRGSEFIVARRNPPAPSQLRTVQVKGARLR
jgi:hypothetical protein